MTQMLALGPIPLEKYSYALSIESARHHVWHHNARRDLLMLKVVRLDPDLGGSLPDHGLEIVVAAGNETLERLDTLKLVRWAREHEQRLGQGFIPSQTEPPVQVVVKFPCIAMRYPDSSPMIRRFQLKFSSEADYLTVRNLFRDIGFPIKESTGVSRPDSRASAAAPRASTNRLAPVTPAPPEWQQTATARLTPTSSPFGSSSVHHVNQFQSSIPNRIGSSSALSMRPPSILSPDIERLRSSSVMNTTNGRSSPFNNAGFQPPPPHRKLDTPPGFTHNLPSYAQEVRSQSSHMQQAYLEQQSPRPLTSMRSTYHSNQPQYVQSKALSARDGDYDSTLSSALSLRRPEESSLRSDDDRPSSQHFAEGSGIKRSSTTQASQAASIHAYEPLSQIRHQSSVHDSMYRPMSTPLTGSQYDLSRLDTSSWIPPKRDLPFPKAKDPRKAEAPAPLARQLSLSPDVPQSISQQRPISPELESSAFKTPTPAANSLPTVSAKPARKRAAPRKKTAVVARVVANASAAPSREIPDSEEKVKRPSSALPQEPVSPLASRAADLLRPASAPAAKAPQQPRKRTAETNIAPAAKVSKMVDSATQTQTGSGREHSALPRTVTISQPSPLAVAVEESASFNMNRPAATATPQQTQQLSPQLTPAELDAIGEQMENFVERFSQPRRPLEIHELPRWDTATENERHEIVEDWMIEQLQDPQFIELCRVVEGTWQRIGIP